MFKSVEILPHKIALSWWYVVLTINMQIASSDIVSIGDFFLNEFFNPIEEKYIY